MIRPFSIVILATLTVACALGLAQDRRSSGAPRGEYKIPPRVQEPRRVLPQGREGRIRREAGNVAQAGRAGRIVGNRPQEGAQGLSREPRVQRREEYHRIFSNVQQGLTSGSVRGFSEHMASQVYVNLRGGESGYYSANQAHYVLENYLKSRKLVNLTFSTIGESEARPYATGSAVSVQRGVREIAQVYVSLGRSGDKWFITQINIY
jgi:hypothetical protein